MKALQDSSEVQFLSSIMRQALERDYLMRPEATGQQDCVQWDSNCSIALQISSDQRKDFAVPQRPQPAAGPTSTIDDEVSGDAASQRSASDNTSGRRQPGRLPNPSLSLWALAALFLLDLSSLAAAFQLDVAGSSFRCMSEDVGGPVATKLFFRAVPAPGNAELGLQSPVRVDVSGPNGRKVFQKLLTFEDEATMRADGYTSVMEISPEDPGSYQICFMNPKKYSGTQRVEIVRLTSYRRPPSADAAAGADGAAGDADADRPDDTTPGPGFYDDDAEDSPLDRLMRRAESTAGYLSKEMDRSLAREERLAGAAAVTSARVAFLSWFGIAVLIGVSAWQTLYLRRFFRSKKLL